MFSSSLLLLLSSIYAYRTDSSEAECSTTESSHHEEVDLLLAAEKNAYVDDPSEVRKISNLMPFLCAKKYPTVARDVTLPNIEFATVAAFMSNISNYKKLKPLFEANNVEAIASHASKAKSFNNFDAMNAFLYNVDAKAGLCDLKFDSNFITYFLLRFHYYLDLTVNKKTAFISGNSFLNIADKKPISFMCIPNDYSALNFGTDKNAENLFNTIITDTVITRQVSAFIKILMKEIEMASVDCDKKNKFSTLHTYNTTLLALLNRTHEVVEFNYNTKLKWLKSQAFKAAFVTFPIEQNVDSSDPCQKCKLAISQLDYNTYLDDNNVAYYL